MTNLTGVNQLTNRPLPLDFSPILCHTTSMNKQTFRFVLTRTFNGVSKDFDYYTAQYDAERALQRARMSNGDYQYHMTREELSTTA